MERRERAGFIFTMDALLTMTLSVLILSSVAVHHFPYPNAEALNAQRLAHDIINACSQSAEHVQSCPFAFPPERSCGSMGLETIAGMYPVYRFFIQYEDPWLLGLLPGAVDDGAGGMSYAAWYEANRVAIDAGDIDNELAGAYRIYLTEYAKREIVEVEDPNPRCVVTTIDNDPDCTTAGGTWDGGVGECVRADVTTAEDCTVVDDGEWRMDPPGLGRFAQRINEDAEDPTVRYVSTYGINFFATNPELATADQMAEDRELDRLIPKLFPKVFPPEKDPPEANPPTPRTYAARTVREALEGAEGIAGAANRIISVVPDLPDIVADDDPARFIKFRRCFDNSRYDDDPSNDCDNPFGFFCPCHIPTDPPPRTVYCVEREVTLCGLNLGRNSCGDDLDPPLVQPLACPQVVTVKVCVWRE
ncbi:MAG: hypothetical protein QF415_09050 [Candidatus Undinarchaeales archaeon]|jgi:hypothetical protein|nr:hypothetical protein [Candidatus Undinarchaeales archaeon]MDP7493240.1 hypothetical protein [Candidatus Undinarchaeales archaeon]